MPEPQTQSDGSLSDDDISALFEFSQEETKSEPTPSNGEDGGKPKVEERQDPAVDPAVTDPSAPALPPPGTGPVAPQPPAVSPADVAELRGQLSALTQVLGTPRQEQQPPQPAPLPHFPVEISDDLVAAVGADDPAVRKQALQTLGSQLGQRIMAEAASLVAMGIQRYTPQLVQQITSQQQMMRTWHDSFYSKFPTLGKTPELKRHVAHVAGHLLQTGQMKTLDDATLEMVARESLRALGINPQPRRVQGTPTPLASSRPRAATGSARPSIPSQVDPNSPEGIMDVLFG